MLSKTDMWDVLKDYPAARVRLEAVAAKKIERYKKVPLEKGDKSLPNHGSSTVISSRPATLHVYPGPYGVTGQGKEQEQEQEQEKDQGQEQEQEIELLDL